MEVDCKTKTKDTRKCYTCNKTGHLARNCSEEEKKQDF
jgi:hypothetical protein